MILRRQRPDRSRISDSPIPTVFKGLKLWEGMPRDRARCRRGARDRQERVEGRTGAHVKSAQRKTPGKSTTNKKI